MPSIRDFNGVDLVANPPSETTLTDAGEGVKATVKCRIIEDTALANVYVNGTLDWNDGSRPTVFSPTAGTISIDASKALTSGQYAITVEGQNFKTTPEQVRVTFHTTVKPLQQIQEARPIIYGPILPRDTGYPNAQQWNFDLGKNVQMLESSVKMLLLTAKGERLMQPEFGTDLRKLLFDQNVANIEPLLQTEINRAFNDWEPRVSLESMHIQRKTDKSIVVELTLLSKLNHNNFQLTLEFNP